jgi:hypothetical protein
MAAADATDIVLKRLRRIISIDFIVVFLPERLCAPIALVDRTALPGKLHETCFAPRRNHFTELAKQTGNKRGVQLYARKGRLKTPGGTK